MLFRSVIFTDAPLLKAIRYRDIFQVVPILYFPKAPFSKYASHFPAYIEYDTDDVEAVIGLEEKLKEMGLSESELKFCRTIPHQELIKREIIQLLTCITNHRFFSYDSSCNVWGIPAPLKNIEELTADETIKLKNQTSHWTMPGYIYPELRDDLEILNFTTCKEYCLARVDGITYFTCDVNIGSYAEVSLPQDWDCCIDRYFSLPGDQKLRVNHCIGLLSDGVSLFNNKRSVSLLAIVSSIEGMALLDYDLYGETPGLKAASRFYRYLRRYVAGKSEKKYRQYYKKRCDISHEGDLFLGDIDVFSDPEKQHEDWMLRLEIMQAARLALFNWLRAGHNDK